MELVILGLVVLFLYVFIRGLSTFSAWVGGSALSRLPQPGDPVSRAVREPRVIRPADGQLPL